MVPEVGSYILASSLTRAVLPAPFSPTVAPTYAERRAPAASNSNTSPGGAPRPDDTNTTAPTYAPPNTAHASVCQNADPQRAAESGTYPRSQASRRPATNRAAMPMTRTSLPGGAVVAVVNR